MITLLRKLFIKDFDKVNDQKVREKHGLLASIGGIFTNILLFVIKLIIGIIAGSMAIISDAINNLTDLISCIVSLIGFKIANKPADEDHPYGHERIEYVTGMIVSFIIIAVGVGLCYTSITSLIEKSVNPIFSIASFIVLGIAIIGKILLGLFYQQFNSINIWDTFIYLSKQIKNPLILYLFYINIRGIFIKYGGELEIRTLARLAPPIGFQDRPLQPAWVILRVM